MTLNKNLVQLILYCLIAAAVLVGSLGAIYWLRKSQLESTVKHEAAVRPSHEVQTEEVVLPLTMQAVGKVVPILDSVLSAEVSGQIVSVNVSSGQNVAKGEVLARIDDAEYTLGFEEARKQEQSLEPLMEQARRQYERTERLFKKEAATRVELERTQASYESAKANYEAAVKKSGQLLTRLNKTAIEAPYEGVIGKKYIKTGDLVVPGSPLFALFDSKQLEINAEVPEGLLPFVHVDAHVTVEIPSIHMIIPGIVRDIVPYGNPDSHTYVVKARLENNNGIYPNSYAVMRFDAGVQQVLLIPEAAVQHVGQLELVLVLDKDKWNRRYIRTGRRFDGRIEVLSGLEKGEIIGYD